MGVYYDAALIVRDAMNTAGALLTDSQAAALPTLYERWAVGVSYEAGERVQHEGAVYEIIQAHVSQADWLPAAALSLYRLLNVEHAGTLIDPIPAAVGLTYKKDLYYSEDDALYLCIRQDTEEGTVLHYLPSQLIGNYFEQIS